MLLFRSPTKHNKRVAVAINHVTHIDWVTVGVFRNNGCNVKENNTVTLHAGVRILILSTPFIKSRYTVIIS